MNKIDKQQNRNMLIDTGNRCTAIIEKGFGEGPGRKK